MNIRAKMVLNSVTGLVILTGTLMVLTLNKETKLREKSSVLMQEQATAELSRTANDLKLMIDTQAAYIQKKLSADLNCAQELLLTHGGFQLGDQKIAWQATNQVSGEGVSLELPQVFIGKEVLAINDDPAVASPLVDRIGGAPSERSFRQGNPMAR